MKTFKARAPMRIGIAGGGSDVEPFSSKYNGAILNVAIRKYAYCEIRESNKTRYVSYEHNSKTHSHNFNKFTILHHNCLKYFEQLLDRRLSCEISTFCDAPMGSGLGSSSSLVVAILKCLSNYCNESLSNLELAEASIHVERVMCGFSGGQQDQFAAAFGGVNHIEFGEFIQINNINIERDIQHNFEQLGLLIETPISRDSANIIEDQKKNMKPDIDIINKFIGLRDGVNEARKNLTENNLVALGEGITKSWKLKKQTSSLIETSIVAEIITELESIGILGVKLCGAGGGGHIFVLAQLEKHERIKKLCSQYNCIFHTVTIDYGGAVSWQY